MQPLAALRGEPGVAVCVLDGARGEFTVGAGGRAVGRSGAALPDVCEVLTVIRGGVPAGF